MDIYYPIRNIIMSADRPQFCARESFDECSNCRPTVSGVCPIVEDGGNPNIEPYNFGGVTDNINVNQNGEVELGGSISGTTTPKTKRFKPERLYGTGKPSYDR
jgi:hypothetical protein